MQPSEARWSMISVAGTVTKIREIRLCPDWEREHLQKQEELGIPLDKHRFDSARRETLASAGAHVRGTIFPSLIAATIDFAHASLGPISA